MKLLRSCARPWIRKSARQLCILLALAPGPAPCRGSSVDDQPYSLQKISEALLAYEAAFDNLNYSYISDMPGLTAADAPRRIASGAFAHAKKEGRVFFDIKPCKLENSHPVIDHARGSMGAFDGEQTVSLDRDYASTDSRGLMRAAILPKYDDTLFKTTNHICPHNYVFGYGDSFGKLIASEKNEIKMESANEIVSGRRTVKLQGKVFQGAGTMTLWVCPELDFLPLRAKFVRSKDNKVMIDYKTSEFARLKNGLHFPGKITIHGWDPNYEATMTMSEVSIDPLPLEFFRPELPPNTHVSDLVLNTSYTTSQAADLGLYEMQDAKQPPSPINKDRQDPNIAQESIEAYLSDAEKMREQASIHAARDANDTPSAADSRDGASNIVTGIVVAVIVLLAVTVSVIALRHKDRKGMK